MPLVARIDDGIGCHGGACVAAGGALATVANEAQALGLFVASGGGMCAAGLVMASAAVDAMKANPCGKIVEGAASVVVEQKKAATLGHRDNHGRAVITQGSSTVSICGRPAARIGDDSSCGGEIVTS